MNRTHLSAHTVAMIARYTSNICADYHPHLSLTTSDTPRKELCSFFPSSVSLSLATNDHCSRFLLRLAVASRRPGVDISHTDPTMNFLRFPFLSSLSSRASPSITSACAMTMWRGSPLTTRPLARAARVWYDAGLVVIAPIHLWRVAIHHLSAFRIVFSYKRMSDVYASCPVGSSTVLFAGLVPHTHILALPKL